jgi:hypothetical protein
VDTANADQTTVSVLAGTSGTLQPSEVELSCQKVPEAPHELLPPAGIPNHGAVASNSGGCGRAASGRRENALSGAMRRVGRALSGGRSAVPARWADQ